MMKEQEMKFTVTSIGKGYVTLKQTVDPIQLIWSKNVNTTTLSRDEARKLGEKLLELANQR